MASLRKLQTCWHVRYYDSGRRPKETTDRLSGELSRSEAEDEKRWRQQLYDRGQYDPWTQEAPGEAAQAPEDPTLSALAEIYVESKRAAGRRGESGGWGERTLKSDGPIIRGFASHVGPNLQVSRLTTGHVREYVYQTHLSRATQRGYHRRVRALLRWAEREGLLAEPPDMPPAPKAQKKVTETVTERELEEICRAHRSIQHTTRRHALIWRFQFYQGLRSGEIYELRRRHVDWEAGTLQIGDVKAGETEKAGGESQIPLLAPGRFYLRPFWTGRAWAEEERPPRDPDGRVFGQSPGARRLSSSFKRSVRAAADAESSSITPSRAEALSQYSLRHSSATHWLRQGKSLIWVNRLLRHAQVQTTMEYVHLTGADLSDLS